MSNSAENFRNDLAARLLATLPQDQIPGVLAALDQTLPDYDIERKPVALITTDGIPEAVKHFLASKAVENLSPATLKVYRTRLVDFFRRVRKPIDGITATDIRLYLYHYKDARHASDSYLDNIRRILSTFFSWLVANEYLIRNPCAKVERIKYQEHQRVPLTAYELEVVRWNCETVREKAMIDLFFSSGIRLDEFCNLNKTDIDWATRSIQIRHGKGNKRRVVFFNAESELSLRKYLESRQDDSEALFVTLRRPHRRLGKRAIQRAIAKVAARTDLHVHPHKLRHTFATSGLRGGMPLEQLQRLMGHAEPKTTLIYAKIDTADLQREHSRVYA